MHTKKTGISEGLVNKSTGTLKKTTLNPRNHCLENYIYEKLDDSNVGKQLKQTCKFKGLEPIKPNSTVFSITENPTSMQDERQFQGTLALIITVHKAQGSTYEEKLAVMTFSEKQKPIMHGLIYTILSKSKSMDRLKLVYFKTENTRQQLCSRGDETLGKQSCEH